MKTVSFFKFTISIFDMNKLLERKIIRKIKETNQTNKMSHSRDFHTFMPFLPIKMIFPASFSQFVHSVYHTV